MHEKFARALLCAAPLLLGACGAIDRLPPPDVVATIGDRELPYAEFESYLTSQVGERTEQLSSVVLSGLLDEFVEEQCLRTAAIEDGLVGEGAGRLEIVREVLGEERQAPIGESEITRYYARNRSRFERPEELRLGHILVYERAAAERAAERLAGGESFAAVAADLSIDPAADRGGDQGFLTLDDLPPAFVEPISLLSQGGVSPVIATEYGFHIFQLVERRPGGGRGLEEARAEIVQELERRRADELLRELVSAAVERYNVAVLARNVPFDYQGKFSSE